MRFTGRIEACEFLHKLIPVSASNQSRPSSCDGRPSARRLSDRRLKLCEIASARRFARTRSCAHVTVGDATVATGRREPRAIRAVAAGSVALVRGIDAVVPDSLLVSRAREALALGALDAVTLMARVCSLPGAPMRGRRAARRGAVQPARGLSARCRRSLVHRRRARGACPRARRPMRRRAGEAGAAGDGARAPPHLHRERRRRAPGGRSASPSSMSRRRGPRRGGRTG